MKTTDLIYQNQEVLNALQELLLHSKEHIEFLAANAPEIRPNLESVAESLQTSVDALEKQILFNRDTRIRFAKECACKNQAYDFIVAEKTCRAFQNLLRMSPHKLVHRFNGCGYYAGQITISTAQRKRR